MHSLAGASARTPSPGLVEGVDFEIVESSTGDTVWVNAADGSCIGRFSKRFGIDVHHSATVQMDGGKQCLFCTHAPAGAPEWGQFRNALHEQYGIAVPENLLVF